MNIDTLVVGAGPAGSTAARTIAAMGGSVVMLDRARFPRDKPCGGCVTIRCADLLPFDLEPVIEQRISGARVRLRDGSDAVRGFDGVLAFMTQRSRLDHFLVQQAQQAGVDFRDGQLVSGIERQHDGSFRVTANGATYDARALIGADGANGVVATALGFEDAPESAIALEGNIAYEHGSAPAWIAGHVALQLGGMPGGYGWVFPKGDHMNVGVGGWTGPTGPRLRSELHALCRSYDLDPEAITGLRGHRLPMARPGAPVVSGGAALIGDAAGFVDPLSGEGIYAAIASAIAVAPAVDDYLAGHTQSLAGYQRTVERELAPDIIASRALMELFHAWPLPWIRLMQRSDRFFRRFARILEGEDTLTGIVHSFGPLRAALQPAARLSRRVTLRRWGNR